MTQWSEFLGAIECIVLFEANTTRKSDAAGRLSLEDTV